MNCANPECGHPRDLHDSNGDCMVGIRGPRVPICPCNFFVLPHRPSREPLMAQLDALIESRTKLPK